MYSAIVFMCIPVSPIVSSLHHILDTIGNARLCSGNSDERFLILSNIHKGVLKDISSKFSFSDTL